MYDFQICPHIVFILLKNSATSMQLTREMVTMALRYGADSGEFVYCNLSANRLPHTSTDGESESNYTLSYLWFYYCT